MRRIPLVTHFIGTSNPMMEGPEAQGESKYDRVDLDVIGGTVSFIVPHNVPDDEILQDKWLERFVGCDVELADGEYVLHLTITCETYGVDVRLTRKER